jgi:hypothetical protein
MKTLEANFLITPWPRWLSAIAKAARARHPQQVIIGYNSIVNLLLRELGNFNGRVSFTGEYLIISEICSEITVEFPDDQDATAFILKWG